jgi:hypothetical protein
MAENQLPEEVVQKIDPNRRKFILGILAAGMTAPTVASFVMGKANKSAIAGTPIRPASLIDSSGNFKFEIFDPSGNFPFESANFIYDNMSGNFLRDASGNFALDPSGNLQCGTSGNVLLDGSGNIMWNYDFSGNFNHPAWQLDPSGNWSYDSSGNIQLSNYWGASLDPSGNQFNDYFLNYDSNGVVDFNSNVQNPGLACVISANHIQQVQIPQSTVPNPTSTVAPTSTSAPTTSNAPTNQNGSPSVTTTTVPVTPIVPNGSIPATK